MIDIVIILHRQVQVIKAAKWNDLEELDKKFEAIEKRIGFPDTKKRWRALMGPHHLNTQIVEQVWESMGKMEKTITKALLDPEYQKLVEEAEDIIETSWWEIYTPLPLPF